MKAVRTFVTGGESTLVEPSATSTMTRTTAAASPDVPTVVTGEEVAATGNTTVITTADDSTMFVPDRTPESDEVSINIDDNRN